MKCYRCQATLTNDKSDVILTYWFVKEIPGALCARCFNAVPCMICSKDHGTSDHWSLNSHAAGIHQSIERRVQ